MIYKAPKTWCAIYQEQYVGPTVVRDGLISAGVCHSYYKTSNTRPQIEYSCLSPVTSGVSLLVQSVIQNNHTYWAVNTTWTANKTLTKRVHVTVGSGRPLAWQSSSKIPFSLTLTSSPGYRSTLGGPVHVTSIYTSLMWNYLPITVWWF